MHWSSLPESAAVLCFPFLDLHTGFRHWKTSHVSTAKIACAHPSSFNFTGVTIIDHPLWEKFIFTEKMKICCACHTARFVIFIKNSKLSLCSCRVSSHVSERRPRNELHAQDAASCFSDLGSGKFINHIMTGRNGMGTGKPACRLKEYAAVLALPFVDFGQLCS